jgi:cell division protein FtsL
MIIPNRKSGVKKISVPKVAIRNILIGAIVVVLIALFVIYDYASIKRDRAELARLRAQTKEQSRQLQDMGMKIDQFADRLEALRQYDKQIRVLAHETNLSKKMPLGVGGSEEVRMKDLVDKDHEQIIAGMRRNFEKLHEEANERERSFTELLGYLGQQKAVLASTPSRWPVKGWVTSEFGIEDRPSDREWNFIKASTFPPGSEKKWSRRRTGWSSTAVTDRRKAIISRSITAMGLLQPICICPE